MRLGKVDVYHGFRGGAADTPEPLGKYVATISYQYANVCHNVLTCISVTGVLHLVNKNLIDWSPKKQSKVETTCMF